MTTAAPFAAVERAIESYYVCDDRPKQCVESPYAWPLSDAVAAAGRVNGCFRFECVTALLVVCVGGA